MAISHCLLNWQVTKSENKAGMLLIGFSACLPVWNRFGNRSLLEMGSQHAGCDHITLCSVGNAAFPVGYSMRSIPLAHSITLAGMRELTGSDWAAGQVTALQSLKWEYYSRLSEPMLQWASCSYSWISAFQINFGKSLVVCWVLKPHNSSLLSHLSP